MKGGVIMTNCTKTCPNVMPVCCQNTGFGNGQGAFAFILVLFILLVICGAAYLR